MTSPLLAFERSGFHLAAIAAFAPLGAPPYLLARRGIGGTPVTAAFLVLDAGILTYIVIAQPPFYVDGWTPQFNLRLPRVFSIWAFSSCAWR